MSIVMERELGMKSGAHTSQVKAVNSQVNKLQELARNVRIYVREFEGRMDLIVIEMDDFEAIISNTSLTSELV